MNIHSDFTTDTINNTFIVTVNLSRATFKEVVELQKLLSNALNNGYKKILVEMMEVDYIDSTFLGLLIVYLKKTLRIEGDFYLVGLKPSVYSIIQNTNLDKTFNIHVSRKEALKQN
jgi:anti-anti-sigma factor